VYERSSTSGQNDPSLWADVSKRDTLLDHQYALLRSKDTVSELINPEVGPAVVEGDKTGLRTSSLPDNRGKQQRVLRTDFQALVDSFETISASAAKYARLTELVALSTTLKNALNDDFLGERITAIKARFEDALRSSAGSPCGSSRVLRLRLRRRGPVLMRRGRCSTANGATATLAGAVPVSSRLRMWRELVPMIDCWMKRSRNSARCSFDEGFCTFSLVGAPRLVAFNRVVLRCIFLLHTGLSSLGSERGRGAEVWRSS